MQLNPKFEHEHNDIQLDSILVYNPVHLQSHDDEMGLKLGVSVKNVSLWAQSGRSQPLVNTCC
jgi:hypothetical protein